MRPVTDSGLRSSSSAVPCGNELAAAHARTGAEVDDVVGVADRVFVMLDDNQSIAGPGQRIQGVEQHRVVARVQSDRRLIENVADALQVGAQLRRQSDALRLAA